MKPTKNPPSAKNKKTPNEVVMTNIDYDGVFKPHDQLTLSADVSDELNCQINI